MTTITPSAIALAVADVMREIAEDIESGTIPANVSSFSELHDHVDANCYGGFCDDGTAGTVHNPRSDWPVEASNAVQCIVDAALIEASRYQ